MKLVIKNYKKAYRVCSDNIDSEFFLLSEILDIKKDGTRETIFNNPLSTDVYDKIKQYKEEKNKDIKKKKQEEMKTLIDNAVNFSLENRINSITSFINGEITKRKMVGILNFLSGQRSFNKNLKEKITNTDFKVNDIVFNVKVVDEFMISHRSDSRGAMSYDLSFFKLDNPESFCDSLEYMIKNNHFHSFYKKITGDDLKSFQEIVELLLQKEDVLNVEEYKDYLEKNIDAKNFLESLEDGLSLGKGSGTLLKMTDFFDLKKDGKISSIYKNRISLMIYILNEGLDTQKIGKSVLLKDVSNNRDWLKSSYRQNLKMYEPSYSLNFLPTTKDIRASTDRFITMDIIIDFELNKDIKLHDGKIATCGDSSGCYIKLIKNHEW